jgi:hypothetical protein
MAFNSCAATHRLDLPNFKPGRRLSFQLRAASLPSHTVTATFLDSLLGFLIYGCFGYIASDFIIWSYENQDPNEWRFLSEEQRKARRKNSSAARNKTSIVVGIIAGVIRLFWALANQS